MAEGTDLRVIGERARRKAACDRVAAGILAELEDGALSMFISRDGDHIGRIVDCHNGPSSCQKFLPRPFKIDNT